MPEYWKIILMVADVQWVLSYWKDQCDEITGNVDGLELKEDIEKIDKQLNKVLNFLHKEYEKDTTVSHSN